jgi:hypothetical protein
MRGFNSYCVDNHFSPLLKDIGADGKTKSEFRVDRLAMTAATEKSWFHRFVDDHDWLKKRFMTVSARSTTLDFSSLNARLSFIIFCFTAF